MSHFDATAPLFVFGIQRSGTTLLASLLDGHAQVLASFSDSRFFKWFFRSRGRGLEERLELAEEILLHAVRPEGAYYQNLLSHVPEPELRAHFRQLVRSSDGEPRDFLEAYLHAIGLATGTLNEDTRYWLEKSERSEQHFRRIHRWWPDARYLHIVRDPRDVFASYRRRDRRNGRRLTSVEAFSFVWGRTARAALDNRERVGEERYRVVRYEDLVTDPEGCIDGVAEFLGIADEPSLHRPTKGHGVVPWGGNAVTGSKRFEISPARLGAWKETLEPDLVAPLEGQLAAEMLALGYEPSRDLVELSKSLRVELLHRMRDLRLRWRHR